MRYKRAAGVLEELVDGRRVLVTPEGDELLTLNESGSVIWDALAEPGDAKTIAGRVRDRFPVDADVLEADAAAFLAELTAATVVVEDSGPDEAKEHGA